MATDETYSCCLCDESLKKAKKELNEDPKERLGQVQQLRDWVNEQPWIECPTSAYTDLYEMNRLEHLYCFNNRATGRPQTHWYRILRHYGILRSDFARNFNCKIVYSKRFYLWQTGRILMFLRCFRILPNTGIMNILIKLKVKFAI